MEMAADDLGKEDEEAVGSDGEELHVLRKPRGDGSDGEDEEDGWMDEGEAAAAGWDGAKGEPKRSGDAECKSKVSIGKRGLAGVCVCVCEQFCAAQFSIKCGGMCLPVWMLRLGCVRHGGTVVSQQQLEDF